MLTFPGIFVQLWSEVYKFSLAFQMSSRAIVWYFLKSLEIFPDNYCWTLRPCEEHSPMCPPHSRGKEQQGDGPTRTHVGLPGASILCYCILSWLEHSHFLNLPRGSFLGFSCQLLFYWKSFKVPAHSNTSYFQDFGNGWFILLHKNFP